jgi:hypothetical protein
MFFGRSKSSLKDDDVNQNSGVKETPGSEDEWCVLKQNNTATSSDAVPTTEKEDEHYEVIDGANEDNNEQLNIMAGEPFDFNNINPPIVLLRHEMAFKNVEYFVSNFRIENEKWKPFIIIFLLGGMFANHTIFYTKENHDIGNMDHHVVVKTVPSVGTTVQSNDIDSHRMGYADFIVAQSKEIRSTSTTAVQSENRRRHPDYAAFVSAAQSRDIKSTTTTNTDNLRRHPDYVAFVAAQAPKDPSEPVVGSSRSDYAAFVEEQMIHGMKSAHRVRLQSSPRPDKNQTVTSLKHRIAELEVVNDQYMNRITRMAIETNTWKSIAVDCNQQLKQMAQKLFELERELQSTKRMVAVGTAPTAAAATATTSDHTFENHKHKKRMASATNNDHFQNNSTLQPDLGSLYVPTIRSDRSYHHKSLIPVGPTALIPTPA